MTTAAQFVTIVTLVLSGLAEEPLAVAVIATLLILSGLWQIEAAIKDQGKRA